METAFRRMSKIYHRSLKRKDHSQTFSRRAKRGHPKKSVLSALRLAKFALGLGKEKIRTVSRGKDDNFSIFVDFGDDVTLGINCVQEGVVVDWKSSAPAKKLEVDDIVVTINGAPADAYKLIDKILKSRELEVHITKQEL
mmetsp:Transcript_146435/g.258054  ORF Transcript_146435/g.258054 Transcript_146435/m.258054 type:complete len:140 (+) Transcript_146435:2-421(+)